MACQFQWQSNFIYAEAKGTASDELQLKLMRVFELAKLLSHPELLRAETQTFQGQSLWERLGIWAQEHASTSNSKQNYKIIVDALFEKKLAIYSPSDIVHLWEHLAASLWFTGTADEAQQQRWSSAISSPTTLLIVFQFNIHHLFELDDHRLMGYLKPKLLEILPDSGSFVAQFNRRVHKDAKFELLHRLLNYKKTDFSSVEVAISSSNHDLTTSSHVDTYSSGSSDVESCSSSSSSDQEGDDAYVDEKALIACFISSVSDFKSLSDDLDMVERIDLIRSIKGNTASIVHAVDDAYQILTLFPYHHWPEIISFIKAKWLTLPSKNTEFADVIQKLMSHTKESDLIIYDSSTTFLSMPLPASSSLSFETAASIFALSQPFNTYLQELMVELFTHKSGDDINEIFTYLPSTLHRELLVLLQRHTLTLTPTQFANLINIFTNDIDFILSMFTNEALIRNSQR